MSETPTNQTLFCEELKCPVKMHLYTQQKIIMRSFDVIFCFTSAALNSNRNKLAPSIANMFAGHSSVVSRM